MTKKKNARILIVDEDASIRHSFKSVLEIEPFDIHEAQNGTQCLAKMRENTYDIIFLAIHDQDTEGVKYLDKIKAHSPKTDVIIISGNMSIRTAMRCLRHGAAYFLIKPFDLKDLLDTIHETLSNQKKTIDTFVTYG